VEARGLKPNTVYFYQWRYRKNDKAAPVRRGPTRYVHMSSNQPTCSVQLSLLITKASHTVLHGRGNT
jgi:hypothetical protein